MIDKAPDAYRTISEVAEDLDLPQHVLRFWETRFAQIKPLKRGGGRRYYRPDDVELLKGIRHLLYAEGYTIKGVQRILKEQGPKAVQSLVQSLLPEEEAPETGIAAPAAPSARPPQAQPAPPAPQPLAPPVQARPAEQRPLEQRPVDPYPVEHWPAPQSAPVAPPVAVAPPAPDVHAWRSEPPVYVPPPPHYQPQYQPPVFSAPPQAYQPPAPAAPVTYPPAPELFPSVAEPAPPPAPPQPAPRAPGATAFMRGGLARTGAPVAPPPAMEPPAAPQTHFGINVRRTITPVPPQPDPVAAPRYSPLVEPELGREPLPAAGVGLSEDSRRALQSALFELTECRRTIDRVIAGRDR